MQLILASQSPYRRAQLQALGVHFDWRSPLVDEEQLKAQGPSDLLELTRYLAQAKAQSLAQAITEHIYLGSDQLVEHKGRRLDKPITHERAKEQLLQLSGQSHRLITSLALVHKGRCQLFTDVATITMKEVSPTVIESYLNVDKPYDCAGSYKIEKAGLALIAGIQTRDPSAIQGLPLMSLCTGLEKLGFQISDFWRGQ